MLIKPLIKYILLTQFACRDLVAVNIAASTPGGGARDSACSAYFPGDSDTIPPPEVNYLINYCKGKRINLIIGCDINAHHTAWSSTIINDRGEYLFEYI